MCITRDGYHVLAPEWQAGRENLRQQNYSTNRNRANHECLRGFLTLRHCCGDLGFCHEIIKLAQQLCNFLGSRSLFTSLSICVRVKGKRLFTVACQTKRSRKRHYRQMCAWQVFVFEIFAMSPQLPYTITPGLELDPVSRIRAHWLRHVRIVQCHAFASLHWPVSKPEHQPAPFSSSKMSKILHQAPRPLFLREMSFP